MEYNEKKFDFVSTCTKMINFYKELKQELQKKDVKRLLNKDVYLIFGPTKSGKSSFLARLIDDSEPRLFYNKLMEISDSRVVGTISGIKIGGGNNSTTIVPNFYPDGDSLIIDLAGFIDTNSEIAPIISMLNYALFPNLIKCKIIVVIDMNSMVNMNVNMRLYIDEFKTLLTSQHFRDGVDSCGFVFTKCDLYEDSIKRESRLKKDDLTLDEAVKEILKNYVIDVADTGGASAALSSKINRNFTVVDYRKHSKGDAMSMITGMTSNVRWLDCKNMKFDAVLAVNLLGKEGKISYDQYCELASQFDNEIMNLQGDMDNFMSSNQKQLSEEKTLISNVEIKLRELESSKIFHEMRLSTNNQRIPEISGAIIKFERDVIDLSKQYEDFKSDASNMILLQIATIKSSKSGMLSDHWIGGEFVVPSGAMSELHIIILDAFEYDSNHTKIQNCETYKQFDEMKLNYIYKNGKKKNDTIQVKMSTRDNSNPVLNITSKNPFVLLCMCDVSLKNTSLSITLSKFHTKRIDSAKDEKRKLEDQSKRLMREMEESTDSLTMINKSIEESAEARDKAEMRSKMIKTSMKEFNHALNTKIDNIISNINTTMTEKKFSLTEELGQILVEAKIEVLVFQDIMKMKDRFSHIVEFCPGVRYKSQAEVDKLS